MPFYNASTKAKSATALKPKPKHNSNARATAPSQADSKLDTNHTETKPDALPSPGAEDGRSPPNPVPPAVDADGKEANKPISPRPLSPLLKDIKDLRAYEHERQRAKRAGEWALKRARKTEFGTGSVHAVAAGGNGRKNLKGALGAGGHASGKTGSAGGGAGIGREDVDVEFVVGGRAAGAGDVAEDLSMGMGSVRKPEPLGLALALVAPAKADLSVSLSELIVPPKSRSKTKKSKSKLGGFGSLTSRKQGPNEEDAFSYTDARTDDEDEEFELVPALRAVIALDEVDPRGRRDMEVDEPWEYVGAEEEEERKRGLSYADVLSGVHLD